jgi:hypothetical protein
MSDLRTAAQQALEALKSNKRSHYYCEDTWYSCPKHEEGCANKLEGDECICGADEVNKVLDAAIADLEAALEQPEPQVVYRLGETDIYDFAGWLTTRPGVMRVGASCEAGSMAEAVGEYLRAFPDRFTPHTPRREWQGLTEEEINEATFHADERMNTHLEFARAIEAALKERNV